MDLQLVYKAGAYIRNTLKRALQWDHEEYLYCDSKRIARPSSLYEASQLISFVKVLENPVIKSFLKFDKCYLLADNYLIAMTYIFLERAKILLPEYTIHYFLSALYLAHEMQEDNEDIRSKIISWYPGKDDKTKALMLHSFKNELWFRMNFRCNVSKLQCDELMQRVPKWDVWERKREDSHSGAFYPFAFHQTKCKNCSGRYYLNTIIRPVSSNDDKIGDFHNCKDDNVLNTSDWEDEELSDADSTLTL